MPNPETLIAFFGVSALLGLAPGPDNLFVLAQSALYGRHAGWWVTAGLCTGLLVHTTAVAVGLAAVFSANLLAFAIWKLLGAGYLLYLAWQVFRASGGEMSHAQPSALSVAALYRRGILMNLANPKVSIFFLALLPQFADATKGPLWSQLLVLGAVFIVATIVVFGAIAAAAAAVRDWLGNVPSRQRMLHRAAGIVFVALAVKLVVGR